MDSLIGLWVASSVCVIWNDSESTIILVPVACPDGAAASDGKVIEELVRKIPPKKSIVVNCSKYDLNGKNWKMQIVIHFVAPEIAENGAEVATGEVGFLHCELRAKGHMYLTCGEGGEVVEVSDESRIEEIKMTMNQNKKMKGSIRGFFSRFISRKSGHGGHGRLSNGQVGLLLKKFFWEYELGTFPAF